MQDRALMVQICTDAARDVVQLTDQTILWGDEKIPDGADPEPVAQAFKKMASSERPLWELQWAMLSLIYVSDELASALHSPLFRTWFDGSDTLDSFHTRLELNIGGRYCKSKSKRGKRKAVKIAAKTPLEIVSSELVVIQMIRDQA